MGVFNLSKNKTNEEVAQVEPQTSTSVDAEKGVDSSTPSEKGHDDESLSSNAQAGVKAVEAAASVWSKYSLWGAYAMYLLSKIITNTHKANKLKHLVDLLRHRPPRSRRPRHEPLCYQRLPSALSHCRYRNRVLHHRRLD